MQETTDQETIINYLRVKPSNHGEVETVLLAVPDKETVKSEISPDERKLIEQTFKEQGTNLIPIIVRRIEPDEEEHEYEVVYGQKWCIIAEELGIDRLWTWVFDLENDEVPLIQQKMAALAESQEFFTKLEPQKKEENQSQQVQENSSDGLVKAFEVNLEPSLLAEVKAGKIQATFEIKPTSKEVEPQPPPKEQSILDAFNNLSRAELSNKLQRANISNNVAQTILNSLEQKRNECKFESFRDLQNRVNQLGERRIISIIDSWN
ncbi:MAG: hypothetical protein ACOC04_04535 [Halothece sp.]